MLMNLIKLAIVGYDSERYNDFHYGIGTFTKHVHKLRQGEKKYSTWYLENEMIYIDSALNLTGSKSYVAKASMRR
jgi:hypothetical protein